MTRLLTEQEMLGVSLISEYRFDKVRDVIEEAAKWQRDTTVASILEKLKAKRLFKNTTGYRVLKSPAQLEVLDELIKEIEG